jgi:hypothetical protein
VLEHCREGETNCWFSIFRAVSFWPHHSDRIPKTTKDVSQYTFLHSCNFYQRIPGTFRNYYVSNLKTSLYIMGLTLAGSRSKGAPVSLSVHSAVVRPVGKAASINAHAFEAPVLMPCISGRWQLRTVRQFIWDGKF